MVFKGLNRYSDLGVLFLRIVIGVIFIYHGSMKWGMWSAPAESANAMTGIMKLLSIVEPLGGLALILGFLTPLAGLGLAIIMVGAIYMKMNVFGASFAGGQGTGWEFDLILLASALLLFFQGAGKYSVDAMMKKR